MELTNLNFGQGFLIDEELMAGVTELEDHSGFAAFIVRHTTGESVGYHEFPALDQALAALSAIPRGWKFENSKSCDGDCASDGCGQDHCDTAQCPGICDGP